MPTFAPGLGKLLCRRGLSGLSFDRDRLRPRLCESAIGFRRAWSSILATAVAIWRLGWSNSPKASREGGQRLLEAMGADTEGLRTGFKRLWPQSIRQRP